MIDFRSRGSRILAALVSLSLLGTAPSAQAQARPGLSIPADPSGVLTAIRAIDFRQLCHCPTVVVDSLIRLADGPQVFGFFALPVAGPLTADAAAQLRLARHRVERSAFSALPGGEADRVFVFLQIVGDPGSRPERRVAVIVTPPDGITKILRVRLVEHRGAWRALEVHNVLAP